MLTLAEVRDHALQAAGSPERAAKLINELGWRDYWQRLWQHLGQGITRDREAYKTGWPAQAYSAQLPEDVANASTTLACMDAFATDLATTGWLHNHVRMWLAAYLVHWRRVNWRAGADWFLEHLLDADPASNDLSWQWIASTFSNKPYIFNRENLERYTNSVYCRRCEHARDGSCPFQASYEYLGAQLFRAEHLIAGSAPAPWPTAEPVPPSTAAQSGSGLLWVHDRALNPVAVQQHHGPAVFIFDPKRTTLTTLKQLVFVAECVAELPAGTTVLFGHPATLLRDELERTGMQHLVTQKDADPYVAAVCRSVAPNAVQFTGPPPFVRSSRGFDLKRFSRYWQRAESSAMLPTEREMEVA